MGRPNESKEKNSVSRRIHINLDNLIKARKLYLVNDGQKFADKASVPDISKELVDFFWFLLNYYATWDTKGRKMQKGLLLYYRKCNILKQDV